MQFLGPTTDYNRLQITKWPHKGGARNGAKLGSMGIIHHARLINIIIIVRRKRINLINKKTNKNLRCGNRKGLLGRNDQTHHRMGPKTMESIPPSKRNTQADIQLRTRQTNHQQETDGCIQIKHNPEHQPSRMSSKSTAYVPPKTASTPTKANTQTCSYLDFNQFLIRRITRNICLRLRIKQIQILTCREQDIR